MDLDDINTAKAIAVSPKLARSNEFAGFRGLGIWSGLSACKKLELTTSKVGSPYRYRLTIDCEDIVAEIEEPIAIDELLAGRFHIQEMEWDADDHFSQVKLEGIHVDRYRELLNSEEIKRYAERTFPIPLDPKWNYTSQVEAHLAAVPWTTSYSLTVDGDPVYRKFPDSVKQPERHSITDDNGREVAIAWVAETSSRVSKKVLDPYPARNFGIRVKNFSIGQRGVYSETAVTDSQNLDWYVGEIYVTDTDIRPDTKRAYFQPSKRHDDVIQAIRRFYSSVAIRARGWSLQVIAENDADEAQALVNRLDAALAGTPDAEGGSIEVLGSQLVEKLGALDKALAEANKTDTDSDSSNVRVQRMYLRRPEVKNKVEAAIGRARGALGRMRAGGHEPPATKAAPPARKTSRAGTSRLPAVPVDATGGGLPSATAGGATAAAMTTRAIATVDMEAVMEAVKAALEAVLGGDAEQTRRILDRLPEELRRRGIDV
jgi:hypothetical protein